ncbi:UDP-glucose--hexose-1-phosphate uridylyltransferase [Pectinatus haikarae]|uniref:Galactose-1-phosphate uridylyltransferase n=1 Tax=Pectinatus haikarae TaxID=349096 RepID=A0ABT9Y6F7_9FIRM|nr:UDP-glucose--hexose-1-phosphate uridylyltransferase [Pectinatus haikarae]MDQ0203131.1 UDPglucose--hexose-1-phosphate uridylyltransferase [Pectinatus haikarae]
MDINHEINRLLNFAQQQELLENADKIYSANLLLDVLRIDTFSEEKIDETLKDASPILNNIIGYAVSSDIIEETGERRDLFDTRIMNCVMMRPSEVIRKFNGLYAQSPQEATKFFYAMSIASNYIRKARIEKNIVWKTKTEYGCLDITINMSKPEKDPRDIIKAGQSRTSSYPLCLLCRENEGFAGRIGHPARQTHRLIPVDFGGQEWFLQYSPYTYYNEHCIVLNKKHIPMKISRATFENLLLFVSKFPHYFIGSNADLPIVGGSILSHDHYQGGNYTFAMAVASIEKRYNVDGFSDIIIGRVKWPMSTIRLIGNDRKRLADLAEHILLKWRGYSDPGVSVLAESQGIPHNTITPIARRKNGQYELDLVLRNNRTTDEYPMGIFHPHSEVHHIKKENIGLIEVMGLAVLPPRLKAELAAIREALLSKKKDIGNEPAIEKHAQWYKKMYEKYDDSIDKNNITDILNSEVGRIFMQVLVHAGVFKRDGAGLAAFDKFMDDL